MTSTTPQPGGTQAATQQAAQARVDFADLVDGLTPEQLNSSTLCDGWTPQLVLAHLVTFVDVPFPKFMFNIAKAKGDFDRAADKMALEIGQRPTAELSALLRERAGKQSKLPMFPPEMTLVDVIVHAQDVRRGLGLEGEPPADAVRTALEFLTTNKRAGIMLEHKGLLDGLRFESTDSDWSSGEGRVVIGPSEALLLAIMRRPVFDELTGDGVSVLHERQGEGAT